jgi:hypothetical protein
MDGSANIYRIFQVFWFQRVTVSGKFYNKNGTRNYRTGRFVCLFVCLFVSGAAASSGPGPPRSRGFLITHNDAPQSVGLLWTSDQPVAETST